MQKAYVRQNFVNGTDPALDEVDMNKIDSGLSEVDDRVILLDGSKADKTQVFACINSIIYTISTGILRITYVSGAVQDVNLGLNNVALSMSPLGVITMQDSEGNTYTCDLREIINSDLSELGDVNITDPEDGQVLKYNAETGKWENGEGGLGTAVSYEAQTLTDSQKAQARSNIDAASQTGLNITGAKNLMPKFWSTQTVGGVTFTANEDGSVVVSGSNTSGSVVYMPLSPAWQTAAGISWLNELIGKEITFTDDCDNNYINTIINTFVSGEGRKQLISAPTTAVILSGFNIWDAYISVDTGASFSEPVTVKPMIRIATDTDDTYEPYAKTNKQLTETEYKPTTDIYDSSVTYAPNDSTKPAYCIFENKLYKNILQCSGVLPTNTTYWQETNVGKEILSINNSLSKFSETLLYEGNIKTGDVITLAENQNHFKWIVLDFSNLKYFAANSTYGISGNYAPLNWHQITQISSYLVIRSVATWTTGATAMHIGATLQANLDTTGMAYFSTAEQFAVKIYGYN